MTLELKRISADGTGLRLEWGDGREDAIAWGLLRKRCPCAVCRTQPPPETKPANPFAILRPEEAQPIKATSVRPVGNYAYAIHFNDGHNSGIYSLPFLRELGQPPKA